MYALWLVGLPLWISLILGVVIGTWFGPYIAAAIVFIAVLPLVLIDRFILTPVAWTLDRSTLGVWIKIGSVLLLLIGFQFDLLSS